MKQTGQIVQLY